MNFISIAVGVVYFTINTIFRSIDLKDIENTEQFKYIFQRSPYNCE